LLKDASVPRLGLRATAGSCPRTLARGQYSVNSAEIGDISSFPCTAFN
jgi:hypothetical protein